MRRKTNSGGGGYNNQHKKQRFQQGGSNGANAHQGHGGRPRKNYAASREKYLAQARDALASGDRVLAENYFQHADHCYRMMAEEGYFNRPQPVAAQPAEQEPREGPHHQEEVPGSTLPAFLTSGFEDNKPAEPVIVQNWED